MKYEYFVYEYDSFRSQLVKKWYSMSNVDFFHSE